MAIKRIYRYAIENDNLRYFYIDENNNKQESVEPLMVNGEKNPRIDKIVESVKKTIEEVNAAKAAKLQNVVEENKEVLDNKTNNVVTIPEEDEIEDEEYDDDVELDDDEYADVQDKQEASYEEPTEEKKSKWTKYAKKTAIVAGLVIALAFGVKAAKDSKKAPAPAPEVTTEVADEVVEPTSSALDELKADSRYTEITENDLVSTTEDFMEELDKHGITVTADDALTYVTVANITHLKETNPELLAEVFGESDSYTVLGKVGHILGQVVTNEVTTKDDTVDISIVYIDETDKTIAKNHMDMLSDAKEIMRNSELSDEEKIGRVQALLNTKFVYPAFDKTLGYDLEDGTHMDLTYEDGAAWDMNAYVTGVAMGDNELKQAVNAKNSYVSSTVYNPEKHTYDMIDYVNLGNNDQTWMVSTYNNELSNDLKAISENAGFTPDIMKLIDSYCYTTGGYTQSSMTMK